MFELSDYEEVKLTPGQFQEWLQQSVKQINGLNRIAEAIVNLKEARLEQKVDHLIELLETGVHFPDLGFINAKLDLILGIIDNDDQSKVDQLASELDQDAGEMNQAINQPKQSEEK
jgi:hypothetical protein